MDVIWEAVEKEPLGFLLGAEPANVVEDTLDFLNDTWEIKPKVVEADTARRALLTSLFSSSRMLSVAQKRTSEGHPLLFGKDVVAALYSNSTRSSRDDGAEASAKELSGMMNNGWTMQFHQPQRFDDSLWRLCHLMEHRLGCLVGVNAYITPPGNQGLAPHWDDVEIFILQVEGEKTWKVYVPTPSLANFPSNDLAEESLGKPSLEVTLNPGDVLYLPRGCIHQAVAGAASTSTHLTLSTYQRWSIGDLAAHVLNAALSTPSLQLSLPHELKQGIPMQTVVTSNSNREGPVSKGDIGLNPRSELCAAVANALRSIADHIEDAEKGSLILDAGIEVMAEDFMQSRLPPHPTSFVAALPGNIPGLDSLILGRCPHAFRISYVYGDGELEVAALGEKEGSVDAEGVLLPPGVHLSYPRPTAVRLTKCLDNSLDMHMMGPEESSSSDGYDSESCSDSEEESEEEGKKKKERSKDEEEEEDEENENEEDGDTAEGLVFPALYLPALQQVIYAGSEDAYPPLRVRDIQLPPPELPFVKEQFVEVLWEFGAISTVGEAQPRAQGLPKNPKKKKAAVEIGRAKKKEKKTGKQ